MKRGWKFVSMFVVFFSGLLAVNGIVRADGTSKLTKDEFSRKVQKLQLPFISNEGQADERVKFYANTFGGTVFVTNDGEIVYLLPKREEKTKIFNHEGYEENEVTEKILTMKDTEDTKRIKTTEKLVATENTEDTENLSFTVNAKIPNVGRSGTSPNVKRRGSSLSTYSSEMQNPQCADSVIASGAKQSPLINPHSAIQNPKPAGGVALKEKLIGAKVSGIKGEGESVTKVSYFKGNDPTNWKSNISTYEMVNLGEVYEGIELKLKAYGNNVEKLFYVKPGADPNQIKICLSGIQHSECKGKQPPESPFIKGELAKSPLEKGVRGLSINEDVAPTFMVGKRQGNGADGLWVNEEGQLVTETELGHVKFTKPIAYQEIDGKRVDVKCGYVIAPACADRDAGEYWGMGAEENNPLNPPKIGKASPPDIMKTSGTLVLPIRGTNSKIRIPKSTTRHPSPATRHSSPIYGFKVASYDKTKDLIIDPLLSSTFLGGSDNDYCRSIALDTDGNVYVTGSTDSSYVTGTFPTTPGAYDTTHNGSADVFVSRFDSDLSANTPPTTKTRPATKVTDNSAILHGVVSANGATTRVWFKYGTTSG